MNEHRVTVAELGAFLAQQSVEFANGSTKTILEANQSKLKRLLGRFSKNSEADQQRLKLHFHLFIAYLAVVVV